MKIPINKGFCVIPPGSRKNLVNTLVCRYTKESSLYNEAPKSAIRQANHYQIITNKSPNHYQQIPKSSYENTESQGYI